jgi:hypothetical protein
MLHWNGYARLRIPQSNCVSLKLHYHAKESGISVTAARSPVRPSSTHLRAFPFLAIFERYLNDPYSATQTDDVGQLYLTNVDFLKNGVPASIIAATVCILFGPLFRGPDHICDVPVLM